MTDLKSICEDAVEALFAAADSPMCKCVRPVRVSPPENFLMWCKCLNCGNKVALTEVVLDETAILIEGSMQ